jgi:hypothetical protein
VRAKVIGEGANLGMTQRGRIEVCGRGGRLNTDAIDNSAGVNTSDVEVNIKIALAPPVREGRLDEARPGQSARGDDRRGRPPRAHQQLPADLGDLARRTAFSPMRSLPSMTPSSKARCRTTPILRVN